MLNNRILKWFKPWFEVDSRALGIHRILLGWLCFWDISRRWNYIDVFYSDLGIQTQFIQSSSFSIFHYIGNSSFIVHLVFLIGILFSILLMLGYKTKLSHFITGAIVISIHVLVTKVGNSGDIFLNCMLVWTFFLPLGKSLSIDSLFKSLSIFKENSIEDLNDRTKGNILPKKIYSLAFFAMLFQISTIYFFVALNRYQAYDWVHGRAFYKMHQLDNFLTIIGYNIREYITYPMSKFFTLAALDLEYLVPLLLFIPFYNHVLRLIAVVPLTIFHIMVRTSARIGLFSQVMITSFPLLIDQKVLDWIKFKILTRYAHKTFILFYNPDSKFYHYSVRIIKRLDVFNRIIFDDINTNLVLNKNINNLESKKVVLYSNYSKKVWFSYEMFGKILSLLPFGFLFSWIFFIPFISKFFGVIYDKIFINRNKISKVFKLLTETINKLKIKLPKASISYINSILKVTSISIVSIMLIAAGHSALIENPGVELFLAKNNFIDIKTKENKGGKSAINKSGNHFNWENKRMLEKIARFPRMLQMWKMFSPNVPSSDKIIVVEAILENGDRVNPFTGKKPNLNSTDYSVLMKNKSQLWRKYFERFERFDANRKGEGSFTHWVMNPNNDYFKNNLNGQKIDSIEIWKITHSSPNLSIKIDGTFNGIKQPKEVKKECLTDKKIYKNKYNNQKKESKEKPIENIQEYLNTIKVKK